MRFESKKDEHQETDLTSLGDQGWYWYYPDWFWPEQIMEFKKLVNKNIQKNRVCWIDDEQGYKLMRPIQYQIPALMGLNINIEYIEPIQYMIYEEKEDHKVWYSGENTNGFIRKMVCVVQLSNEEDYEGCNHELILLKNGKPETESVKFPKNKGAILCFSSNAMIRCTSLISGKRECLVCWFCGPY